MNGVLRLIDGIDIERAHNLGRDVGLAIDDAHHLTTFGIGGVGLQVGELSQGASTVVFHAADVLARSAIPNAHEDGLQFVDSIALNATMHIAPFAHLLRTFYIIVGYVHASCIGYLSVDNHNLTMIASEDVVDPRESDGGVFHNINAVLAEGLQMILLQGLVVGVVAKTVEHGAHLDTLLALLAQNVEKERGNGVVAEIEILQVDAALSLTDGLEHIVELLLTREQQRHTIVVRETDITLAQGLNDERVGGLSRANEK